MKGLLINADDFGLREGVNTRIVEGFQAGLLASTSLLANTPAAAAAIDLARKHPGLAVGVHLNLSQGVPVAPRERIRSLLNRDGCFPPSAGAVLRRSLRNAIDPDEVRTEWEAQIALVADAGVRPSHLDGHHHVHLLPRLFPVAASLARRFAIPAVRVPRSIQFDRSGLAPVTRLKWWTIAHLARRHDAKNDRLDPCDAFFELPVGLGGSARYQAVLDEFLLRIEDGVTELACHPGYAGPDPNVPTPEGCDPELAALADPAWQEAIQQRGIRILHRRDLRPSSGEMP